MGKGVRGNVQKFGLRVKKLLFRSQNPDRSLCIDGLHYYTLRIVICPYIYIKLNIYYVSYAHFRHFVVAYAGALSPSCSGSLLPPLVTLGPWCLENYASNQL